MIHNSACYHCRNSENGRIIEPGWAYDCKLNLDTSNMSGGSPSKVIECPGGDVKYGFQVGGYWTNMWFEKESTCNQCLRWITNIKDEDELPISLHICDFEQLEEFVEFWRKELERRGWISPRCIK